MAFNIKRQEENLSLVMWEQEHRKIFLGGSDHDADAWFGLPSSCVPLTHLLRCSHVFCWYRDLCVSGTGPAGTWDLPGPALFWSWSTSVEGKSQAYSCGKGGIESRNPKTLVPHFQTSPSLGPWTVKRTECLCPLDLRKNTPKLNQLCSEDIKAGQC